MGKMKISGFLLLFVFAFTLICHVSAHKSVVNLDNEEDDEFVIADSQRKQRPSDKQKGIYGDLKEIESIIEHRIGHQGQWVKRGKVRVSVDSFTTVSGVEVENEKDVLDTKAFKEACSSDEMYFVRVNSTKDAFVTNAIPSCLLLNSNFEEVIEFSFGKKAELFSISISTRKSFGTAKASRFKTLATVNIPYEPIKIPTQDLIGKQSAAAEKAEKEEDPGFLRKYWWMILVALFILPQLLNPNVETGENQEAAQ